MDLQAIKERQYKQKAPEVDIRIENQEELVEFIFYALADRHALIQEVERLHGSSIFEALVEIDNQSLRTQNFQLFKRVNSLQEEIKCLCDALEYYADINTHWRTDDDAIEFDEGERARKALKGPKPPRTAETDALIDGIIEALEGEG